MTSVSVSRQTGMTQVERWMGYAKAAQARADAALARVADLESCDCVPALVSSKSCRKCGRRGTIKAEHFTRMLKEFNAATVRVAELEDALREIVAAEANTRVYSSVCARDGCEGDTCGRHTPQPTLIARAVLAASGPEVSNG